VPNIGVPIEFKDKPTVTVPGADADKLPSLKKTTVQEICKLLGAKWNN
jgi:hypothetical protein